MPITTLLSWVIFQRKQRIPDSCLRLPQHKRFSGNSSSISHVILYVRRKVTNPGYYGKDAKAYRAPTTQPASQKSNPTQASNVCKAASTLLFQSLNGPNELPKKSFEFPFSLICLLNILTGQSWRVIKFGYTVGSELRTDLTRGLVSSEAPATNTLRMSRKEHWGRGRRTQVFSPGRVCHPNLQNFRRLLSQLST